jgi:Co/Zn/Cd efflux system component
MVNLFRILAVIAIIAGFFLKYGGWPEGDTVMKCGIAAFILILILSFIRISKYSRGTYW